MLSSVMTGGIRTRLRGRERSRVGSQAISPLLTRKAKKVFSAEILRSIDVSVIPRCTWSLKKPRTSPSPISPGRGAPPFRASRKEENWPRSVA